ncbi:hypothetical protein SALBM311S_06361 [Streptomyces alboniger]
MACSVTSSHPLPRCAAGLRGAVVNALLSNSTPCCVHGVRSPFDAWAVRGRSASRKMFSRLPGNERTSGATAKLSPMAIPGVG